MSRVETSTARRELMSCAELRDNGVSPADLERATRSGSLVRVHRGVYAVGPHWRHLTPGQQYRLFVEAVSMASSRSLVLSHYSAAAVHGLPLVSEWPRTVHIATPGARGGSSQTAITAHTGRRVGDLVRVDGHTVTSPARTVVDLAATAPFIDAITLIDAALRRPTLVSVEQLADELRSACLRHGAGRAARAISLGDGGAESVGESLSRARIHELGFEIPELQTQFTTANGRYRVDFYWRAAHIIGEFDGRSKYSRTDQIDRTTPEDVVWNEKKREDALRLATGAGFLRWTWSTALDAPRFARLLSEGGVPRRRRPLPW